MSKLKVVSIGAFGHLSSVLNQVADSPDAEAVGLAPAFEAESLEQIVRHRAFGPDVRRFENYRQMLEELKPDVAIVSTRLDQIGPAAAQAARAGCHLICEKPLAITPEGLKEVHQAVKGNGVGIAAMFSMHSKPPFIAARNAYSQGQIGEVVLANGRKSYRWGTRPDWFGQRSLYGGTIGWVGIHALDFISFITGQRYVRVAAMHSNFAHKERKECEDNCGLVLELTNGGHATVSVDYCRPSTAPTHGDDWVRIVGTKGVIEANASQNFCRLISEEDGSIDLDLPESSSIYMDFLAALAKGNHGRGQADYPFHMTDTCLRATDAADKGLVIEINSDVWAL